MEGLVPWVGLQCEGKYRITVGDSGHRGRLESKADVLTEPYGRGIDRKCFPLHVLEMKEKQNKKKTLELLICDLHM